MQSSYSQNPVAGLPGQLANGRPSDLDTRITEGVVKPGGFVVASDGEGECKHPTGAWTVQTALGIAVLDPARVVADFADKETCSVARKGCWLVSFEPDTVPTPDTPAFARHTANGAGKLQVGAWRANADTGAAQVTGAYWRAVKGNVAELELNL